MSTIKVIIKWGKEKYDIEVDPSQPGTTLKQKIQSLTKVPSERQKLMYRGGNTLKDETILSELKGIKTGYTFMMTGTADEDLLKEPIEKVTFVEDQPESSEANYYPPGLENLGNTCYMNSTLQCFRAVPELTLALRKYKGQSVGPSDNSFLITDEMKKLFGILNNTNESVSPITFTDTMRKAFPQFAERGQMGEYMQQDAEECWTQLLRSLSEKVPKLGSSDSVSNENSIVRQLFVGKMEQTLVNTQNPQEKPVTKEETFAKLSCHIDNNTNFLSNGLRAGLEETVEKNSPLDNQPALYKQTSRIKELPVYLTIQFVRFFWKKNVKVSKDQTGLKAKIVHPVEFPMTLDIFDLCTEELQESLKKERLLRHDIEEKILIKQKEDTKKGLDKRSNKEEQVVKKPKHDLDDVDPASLKNESATYELAAVLSHKGRSADGGHYVAWVKVEDNLWALYDDDTVSYVRDEDVKKLSGHGGADWHISYLCLYRSKPRPVPPPSKEEE